MNRYIEIQQAATKAGSIYEAEVKRLLLSGLILSPYYFSLPLSDRNDLVKRLCALYSK